MKFAILETNHGEYSKGIFSFSPMSFPIENIDDVLIICLSNLSHGLPLQLKAKPS